MAPELRHLRHFVAVAEELNFTRAAGRLFLAQQAPSSSIKQLENELGQPLFVRDTRRVALTPAGETLLPRARRMLAMAEETVAAVRDGTPDRAVLRIDISFSNPEDRPRRVSWPPERRCVVPTNAWLTAPEGVVFRPLVDPVIWFPWSVMWADEGSEPVEAFLAAARAVGRERGWRA